MKGISKDAKVYVWLGATDMRAGFDRLSQIIKCHYNRSAIDGGYYVFFSRNRKRVKILYWDEDGYALWYKRLEVGCIKVRKKESSQELQGIDLKKLLMGIDLSRINLQKEAQRGLYF